ncbi:hypothetical protein [Couchioplanes caeruleus]|uniref:Uncharacterized protein n=2 Tax=Couchioplanes caeruleus TaxID=56438 RepID=A0A1K0FLQ8_9ACTN|nr:hypothetical protein [Couchioplanes caeruleus]OJF13745.1 hypothetical protein BG844_13490 [Couchioplanes caeruleus subsp. caeruleus]ROP33474.1 hypothetical protein EDD30_6460 [Couchioplanes caeruleus]
MTQPWVSVAAPPVVPYRYGLFSAAAVLDPADAREFMAGVQWEPVCADAPAPVTLAEACAVDRPPLHLPPGVDVAQAGPPISLYTGFVCALPGRDDLLERAHQKLGLIEQQSLEHYAWTGTAGNRPRLADPDTEILGGSAAAPVSAAIGLGLLEAFVSDRSGGIGVLWAPRWTAGVLTGAQLLRVENPRLVAPLGNPVVFAHTDGAGPDGTVPPAGDAWLYATGAVQVRRGAVSLPTLPQALSTVDNEVFAVAQRRYLVGWGCAQAAVKVRLPQATA